jgi:hypothetical protein
MIQAAQSTPAGVAGKPIFTDNPQAGAAKDKSFLLKSKDALMSGGQDPKITSYLLSKKKDLAAGGQDPKLTGALTGGLVKDKAALAKAMGAPAGSPQTALKSVVDGAAPAAAAPSLASLLSSPDGQIRLPAGLTGALTSGANMVARGAGAVGGSAQDFMQSATNPLRNIPNFF